MNEAKQSLMDLIIGIWVAMGLITISGIAVAFVLEKPSLPFFLGEFLGSLTATGLAYHMYYSLDIALDIGEKANGYTKRAAFLRSIITIAILVVSFYLREIFYPLATFLGLYGMKISFYLQPTIKKTRKRKEFE